MDVPVTPKALPSSALLPPKEAAEFYESACRREGVFLQSTFLKQLLLGSAIIQFENGYLGGSGIGPIIRTLQCVPLRALLLERCSLNAEDLRIICAGLAHHPQLEKIDIRGVPLTIAGAKELLSLVRNTHITEVSMDESSPKYVAIQQQCNRNTQATYRIDECVMCGAGVSSNAATSCETLVTRLVLEHLNPATNSVSVAGLRVLCGALQQCLDRNGGALAVCAGLCAESLAEDLCRCVSSVTKALLWQRPYDAPSLVFLRAFLTREHSRLQVEAADETLRKQRALQPELTAAPSPSLLIPGPLNAEEEQRWCTKRLRTDIDAFLDEDSRLHLPCCTVCGFPAVCSQDGPTWLLRVLQKDITEHGAAVTPVALTRLSRLFRLYANLQPCSRRCVRHLVRYGLYGYGGVICSYASGYPPLSSVVGGHTELNRLPLVNFSVVDIEREVVEDVCGGELNCALTVASALGDDAATSMDPYLLFSIGRHLRKQSVRTIGMDLASACEAARLVGCLPVSEAPFNYCEGKTNAKAPPRDLIADWTTWSSSTSEAVVKKWLHHAFAHRRQCVAVVDGPHRDLFDNIRAALWTLRQQARSILVTIKFAVAWLSLPNGVIAADTSAHTHGIYTTAKVVGQSTLANTVYIILQCPFGSATGHRGFFYFPKSIFLQTVRGLAFVFVDAVGLEYRSAGQAVPVYAYQLVGRHLGAASPDSLALLRRLCMCLMALGLKEGESAGTVWESTVDFCDVKEMRRLFRHGRLPAPLQMLRDFLEARRAAVVPSLSGCRTEAGQRRQQQRTAPRTYWERVLFFSRYPSQLLFLLSQLIGTRECAEWFQEALRAASTVLPTANDTGTLWRTTLSSSRRSGEARLSLLPPSPMAQRCWIVTHPVPAPVAAGVDFAAPTLLPNGTPDGAGAPQPPSPPQRKSGRREQTVSVAPKLTSVKSPQPPSAPPSRDKKRKTLKQSSSVGSAHKKMRRPTSVERQASEEGANTADAFFTASSAERRTAFTADQTLALLQHERTKERAQRQAALQAAPPVGLLLSLRACYEPTSTITGPGSDVGRAWLTKGANGFHAHDTADGSQTAAAIQSRLVGRPWLAVPFPDRSSAAPSPSSSSCASDTLLLFLGDTVSAYSQSACRLLCGPVAMRDDPVLADFPFRTGVDAAVTHPTQPHLVFFFSGMEWLLFDVYLAECVDGPYAISRHGQFRRLPAIFHDGLDGVVHIPCTQLLVFFRDYCYVVFDACTRRCVGGVGFLHPPSREPLSPDDRHASVKRASSMPPALEDLIRTLYPTAAEPRNAKLKEAPLGRSSVVGSDADDDAEQAMQGASAIGTPPPPFLLSSELQGLLGTAPMTAFWARSADGDAAAETCYVVSRTGVVLPVRWQPLEEVAAAADSQASGGDGHPERQRRWLLNLREQASLRAETPLQNLPLVFRQFTTAALPSLCALAVETAGTFTQSCTIPAESSPPFRVFCPEKEFLASLFSTLAEVNPRGRNADGGSISVHVPTGMPNSSGSDSDRPFSTSSTTRITSSLRATRLGERVPQALSRLGSALDTDVAVPGSTTWHDEALFYGDAEVLKRPCESGLLGSHSGEPLTSLSPPQPEACVAVAEVKSAHTASFIEYDLGASAPQRVFTAVLLILDTSALPPSVLPLSPLTASIDSSSDGEVYCFRAIARINGPVVTARWGSGPGSVCASAARFWRLRFCSPVPTSLGFVRLFWMEEAASSCLDAHCQVPTMFSPCTPVMLTVPPSPPTLTVGDGAVAAVRPYCSSGRSAARDPLIIEAEELFQASTELISRDNLYPVFIDDPSSRGAGWFATHTVIPKLDSTDESTCLFVCASSILQVGWTDEGAAIAATQAGAKPIGRCTGFCGIPYPFVLGWDAAFYPAPREHPNMVALLRGDWMLLWDLYEQRSRGGVLPWRTSSLLSKLAALPIATVKAVINCWSSVEEGTVIGVFHVASLLGEEEVQYVEFDVETGTVRDAPVPLAACLMDRFGAAPPPRGRTLHTVLCMPRSPSTWYMFWDLDVQRVSTTALVAVNGDDGENGAAAAHPLAESRLFFSVPLYLREWGQPQHHCRVLLHVPRLLADAQSEADDGLLITGIQFDSSGGREGERACWLVQCSENAGGGWKDVATHYQPSGSRVSSETLWAPSEVCALSKSPYWQLSRVASSQDPDAVSSPAASEAAVAQLYLQLRLLTVPRRRCRQLPTRVSGCVAATPAADISSFFTSEPGSATLSLQPSGSATTLAWSNSLEGIVYELMWDYGSAPVALCSVSVEPRCISPLSNECTWTMWCSSTAIGTGTCCAKTTRPIYEGEACDVWTLSWLPDGPYRYWRLQCELRKGESADFSDCALPSLDISSFSAHEYDGPHLTLTNATGGCLRATPLLWPMAGSPSASPYQMQCVPNSVVQLGHIPLGLTLWEMEFFCEGESCTARIAVESTNDVTQWLIAAETTINTAKATASRPQLCSLSWRSCGARVLWRLRVLESSAEVTLHLTRMRLGHCPSDSRISFSLPPPTTSSTTSPSSVAVAAGIAHRDSCSAAVPEAPVAPVSVSMLSLAHPHRVVRVRAVLPDGGACYNVEYLGLDGASWLLAAVLDGGCVDAPSATSLSTRSAVGLASVSWDGTLVSPSTHWRLRPADGLSLDQPQHVKWFEYSSERMVMIDTADIPGMAVSTAGFTEVQLPAALSGSAARIEAADASKALRDPPTPVLHCTVQSPQSAGIEPESTRTTVTWSFISPLTFDQLLLCLQMRVEGPVATAAEETRSTRTDTSMFDDTAAPPAPPPSPKLSKRQPLQRVLVETSVNGQDYVAVSEAVLRLCDSTVSLRWREVPAAAFWRLRFAPGVAPPVMLQEEAPLPVQERLTLTLQLHAARWLVRREGPAILAEIKRPTLEYYSNTVFRSWVCDAFSCEKAFMHSCLRAFEEYQSTQSKLRKAGDISRLGEVAGVVQQLRQRYQTFLQKSAKDAGRYLRMDVADAVLKDDTRMPSAAPPLLPPSVSANMLEWLSKARLSSDLIYLLLASATTASIGGPHLLRLVELLHHPLAFRQALRFTKRSTGWFYPSLEAVGALAEDWNSFPAARVCASFSVLWSLSTPLQRQLDVLLNMAERFTPLSEHVASLLIVVRVAASNWVPSCHFPTVAPFLDAVGFGEEPVTAAFAINDIVFTPPYAMGIPGPRDSEPLLSPYPYMIAAGVNFVQQCPLARCPATVMDVLRYILPPSAFVANARENAAVLTTLVLTVSSLSADSAVGGEEGSAVLRFTVSGAGVNFGLTGLTMESIEFEVLLVSARRVSADGVEPVGLQSYKVNFISHGARFVGDATALAGASGAQLEEGAPTSDIELPLSLIGAMDIGGLPLVSLRGDFGNARFTEVADLPGAVVTHLQFTTISHVQGLATTAVASSAADRGGNSKAPHWVCAPLGGEGQVLFRGVPASYSCACTIDTARGEGDSPVRLGDFHIAVACCSIEELEAISRACSGDERGGSARRILPAKPGVTAYDVGRLRVEVAATLRVSTRRTRENSARVSLKGKAVLSLENTVVPDATLEIDCEAGLISLTARCVRSLVIGAILVEGSVETPISIQLIIPAAVSSSAREGADKGSGLAPSVRLLLCGHARLFGAHHAARITLEVSQSTELLHTVTLVAASARYPGLAAALQDCVVSEVWRFAQMSLNESALRRIIVRDMGSVPIIAAMQAHQIPLVLSVTSIAPEPYDIVAQRLSCRVKGQLYGAAFDVVTSVVAPDDSDDLWSFLGAQCVPSIVEQCEANLWASYANVVGLREGSNGCNLDANATM
ncbi:hypothetical protein LSCM1_03857 [Leishmania martiniquensis]|uniref:Uncharacterized protein n=1 Tax=Leishmania martiniquensis TaxID=1580590 RepID=A0A836GZB9_9TRYP|nr:hypothetical protein LSCM1_03857 [Leishmania martiniquensis]